MPNPQQPGVARSRKVGSIAPDALESELEAQRVAEDTEPQGHVPPANRPGHEHDAPDQVDPERIASQGDVQKHRLQKSMEDQGLDKETAENVANDAASRMAESGDSEPKPDLPSQISPSANPPGNKNRKPDEPAAPTVEDWVSEL